MNGRKLIFALLIAILIPVISMVHAQAEPPVVYAVLFYSPTCGHCEFVINQTILPMMDEYDGQLQVIGINVTQPDGQALFLSATEMFKLEQAGVPFLVIDDMYLIGSTDIPEKFPELVKTYLAQGGVGYPAIPGLQQALGQTSGSEAPTESPDPETLPAQAETLQTPASTASAPSTFPTPTMTPGIFFVDEGNNIDWADQFARDPIGNMLAVVVLIGMLAAVVWVFFIFRKRGNGAHPKESNTWVIPTLCVIGMGVAGYLTFVETTQTTAVCGPVGDCNTVQQSEYALLFGILPIGILGLIGYTALLVSWLMARYAKGKVGNMANIALFLLSLFGTFFSIYLTFLEPFVIGATCAWCLTSAILMTILMLLTVKPAITAFTSPKPRRHVR
ncbi:MAG: hypothetical protein IPG80_09410 [Anaerolineales bacterium]|uniref:vitamin K epoxide reductase family protein n=1 Tax=Candidatus Villigracilis vicinus TaxID=3140679 RepID=UPI00313564FD|nr:hypothetical protein [Anaerolineales bacterium]